MATLAIIHLGATLLWLTLPWPFMVQSAGLVLIVLHGIWMGWRQSQGPRHLTLRNDGTVVVGTEKGRRAVPVVSARHLPGAVQLTMKPEGGRSSSLLLMQDAVSAADFHELCARIRQQRLPVRDPETSGQ